MWTEAGEQGAHAETTKGPQDTLVDLLEGWTIRNSGLPATPVTSPCDPGVEAKGKMPVLNLAMPYLGPDPPEYPLQTLREADPDALLRVLADATESPLCADALPTFCASPPHDQVSKTSTLDVCPLELCPTKSFIKRPNSWTAKDPVRRLNFSLLSPPYPLGYNV